MIVFQTLHCPVSCFQHPPSYCTPTLRPHLQLVRSILPCSNLHLLIIYSVSPTHNLWLNSFLHESFSYSIFIIFPRLNLFHKRHCSSIRVETAYWVCSYGSRGLRRPKVNVVPWCILFLLCHPQHLGYDVPHAHNMTATAPAITWRHSSSHHMETWPHLVKKGIFFLSCISILGKNFLPMPKLLWRGNWVSGIGSLYNGSHVLPSRRKEGVRVGGKWLYVCKEWYLPQELFSHLTLSLFQLGFWPFHTVLVKVNSNLHLTKSIGRLSVLLFGLSAALKVGTSSFSMKHLPSLWHQILPVFSLSHWPAFPSLPACSSSSAGLHVLSFPGLPLAISLFTCREGVERDVIKFIFMRIVPIFTSPASTAPLSFKLNTQLSVQYLFLDI